MRVAFLAAFCLLAIPAPAAGAYERCCFAVRVDVSGRIEVSGRAAQWQWTIRHVARFVDKGRIFAGLTRVPEAPAGGAVRFRLAERGPGCTRVVRRAGLRPGAFASLEDRLAGGEALVVRSGVRVRPRCGPAVPLTLELPSPGRGRFRGDGFRRVYATTLDHGSARVVISVRRFPRGRLAAELARLCG